MRSVKSLLTTMQPTGSAGMLGSHSPQGLVKEVSGSIQVIFVISQAQVGRLVAFLPLPAGN